jgi:phage FluMu protein Com
MPKPKDYRCKKCNKPVRPQIESLAYDKKLCPKCLDKEYNIFELMKMQSEKENKGR